MGESRRREAKLSLEANGSRRKRLGKTKARPITCSEEYARIFGMSIDAIMSASKSFESDLKRVHPDDRKRYDKAVEEFEDTTHLDIEYPIIRKDGEVRHVDERGVPVFDEHGRDIGSSGILQDITGRKNVEKQLREARGDLEIQVEERKTVNT